MIGLFPAERTQNHHKTLSLHFFDNENSKQKVQQEC